MEPSYKKSKDPMLASRIIRYELPEVFTACPFPFNCTQSEKLGAMDVRSNVSYFLHPYP